MGGTGAAGGVAPLCVPTRALCGSPFNCHHEFLSMLASTWGVRASGSPWQGQRRDVAGSDMEPVVPGRPTPQPARSRMAGTWGCTGTAAPGTTSPCWPRVPCCHLGAGAGSCARDGVSIPGDSPSRGAVLCHAPGWHRRSSGRAAVLCCTAATLKPSLSLSPSPLGVTAPGRAALGGLYHSPRAGAVPAPGPGTKVLLAKTGSCPVSPRIGSGAASPERGPSSRPVLGQGCGWGALLSLQHPSSGWGAIALIRVISLAQLRSSSRLENVGATRWLPGNWGLFHSGGVGSLGGCPCPVSPWG